MIDWIDSTLDTCVDGVLITIVSTSSGLCTYQSVQLYSLSALLWMICHAKTPAWFALLCDGSHSVASRLGSLLSGVGARTANSSSQPTTQWDIS